MQEFWNQQYKKEDFLFGKEPNEFFKTFIDHLPPGRILLPGAGEGRNALYAAKAGWEVEAFDVSPVAREKAMRFAENEGIHFHYSLQDARSFEAKKDYFDLVAIIFLHLSPKDRQPFHHKIVECLKPQGGSLYLMAFARQEENLGVSKLPDPSFFYTPRELNIDFKSLNIDLLQEEDVLLKEGKGHSGKARVIKLKAVRSQITDENDRITL